MSAVEVPSPLLRFALFRLERLSFTGYLFKFISVVFLSEMLKKDMQFFILGNIF